MSLAPGEQRTLAEIESCLCRSDPGLAAMFNVLARTDPRKRPARERLRRHAFGPASSARMIIVLAVGAAFLIACLVIAVLAATHSAPPQHGHGPGASPSSVYLP